MKWKGWIVTADWYDEMGSGHFFGDVHYTRKTAIKEFIDSFPDSDPYLSFNSKWRRAKRNGWRCVKCTVSW